MSVFIPQLLAFCIIEPNLFLNAFSLLSASLLMSRLRYGTHTARISSEDDVTDAVLSEFKTALEFFLPEDALAAPAPESILPDDNVPDAALAGLKTALEFFLYEDALSVLTPDDAGSPSFTEAFSEVPRARLIFTAIVTATTDASAHRQTSTLCFPDIFITMIFPFHAKKTAFSC
jgi:hypothetical protein